MTPGEVILTLMICLLGALVIVIWRANRRRDRFDPKPSRDHVFRCTDGECRYVYTDDEDVDRSRCPQCGRMNESVVSWR